MLFTCRQGAVGAGESCCAHTSVLAVEVAVEVVVAIETVVARGSVGAGVVTAAIESGQRC